jgi:iron(III) transport system ATP-binding protein
MKVMPEKTAAPAQTAPLGDETAVGRGNSFVAPALELSGVRKEFRRHGGARVAAIDDVSLTVGPSEIVVLLGPSGCGKTTLLRSVAGLEDPDTGSIVINGREVYNATRRLNAPPEKRPVGMIFQSYALWPHMTVFNNVAFPLKARRVPSKEVRDRVMSVLRAVGCEELAKQHPGQLSGGQQQRTALARALIAGDTLLLFDEPLSNVDAKVRERLRVELLTMQAEIGFAALYVTHDQHEAMELADRIAVLNAGHVEQLAPPDEIYERPKSWYVADFVGQANKIAGTMTSRDGERLLIDTDFGVISATAGSEPPGVGDTAIAVWRPERSIVSTERPSGDTWSVPVDVVATLYSGAHVEYVVSLGDGHTARIRRVGPLPEAGTYWLSVQPTDLLGLGWDGEGAAGTEADGG